MTELPAPLSGRNPRIATLRRLLGRRSARQEAARFVLEGTTLLDEAVVAHVAGRATLHEVYVDADAPDLHAVVALVRDTGAEVWPVATGVVARLASTTTPQPVLAVASVPGVRRDDLSNVLRGDDLVPVLVDVGDPGNVGTLLRSAAAAGARLVMVAGATADPFGPKAVRASAGAVLRVPVLIVDDPDELSGLLGATDLRVVASVVSGGPAPEEVPLGRGGVALLLGSEAHGLSPETVALASETVTIPMAAGSESLNVAMAGTVLLLEAARQRRAGP